MKRDEVGREYEYEAYMVRVERREGVCVSLNASVKSSGHQTCASVVGICRSQTGLLSTGFINDVDPRCFLLVGSDGRGTQVVS